MTEKCNKAYARAASRSFTGRDSQTQSCLEAQKSLLNTDILSVFKSVNTLGVISTSLLCFKGGCCWVWCYFWQNDWLVGTSLSSHWKCNWAQSCSLAVHPPDNRAGSVRRLLLPGSPALRAAGLLCPSHPPTHHFLLHPSFYLAISRLSRCSRWISHPDHTKTNHFSTLWLLNVTLLGTEMFALGLRSLIMWQICWR